MSVRPSIRWNNSAPATRIPRFHTGTFAKSNTTGVTPPVATVLAAFATVKRLRRKCFALQTFPVLFFIIK